MPQFIKQTIFPLILTALVGCTMTQSDLQQQATEITVKADASPEIDPSLPNKELDADLLAQMLITDLASYEGEWQIAYNNALAAAHSSNDYRVARLATSLALKLRDYQQAVVAANLWNSLQADNEQAKYSLLLSQVGSGETEKAISQLEAYLDDDIDEGIKQVSGLVSQQTNRDAAFKVMEHFMQRHPDSAQVALSSMYVGEAFGDKKRVHAWLQKALEIDPDWDLAAQMKLGLLQRDKKNEERSAYLKEFVERNPKSARILLSYAQDLAAQEQYSLALNEAKKVLKIEPDNEAALNFAGALSEELEQLDEAQSYYQKVVELDDKNDRARWSLARLGILAEDYSLAADIYNKIRDPELIFNARLQAAKMQLYINGLDESLSRLERIFPQTHKEYVDHALARHYMLLEEYRYQEAINYLNEVIVILPEDQDLLYARALAAAEVGELAMVENDLRFVIDRDPQNANALNALGYTLADQTERLDEALKLITQALSLRPKDAHILDSMGWVLYRQKSYSEAIKYLQQAYDADHNPEIAAHLGEVLWEAGQQDEAHSIWQIGIDLDDKNRVLNETLKRYGVEGTKK